jgi:GNAT superfamily N-acetyltransferase
VPAASPQAWILRRATAADAAELARLSCELGYAASSAEIAQRLAALDRGTELVVVAAPAAGGPLARASAPGASDAAAAAPRLGAWLHAAERVSLESGLRVEIAGLVVAADCRRQRLGAALVAEAERWARERRATLVVVRSNVTRNESHEFYPALGYARGKTQHVYTKALKPRERS